MTFTYTRDIPDGPHNPSADQGPMKINTNSLDSLIDVDHVSFNLIKGGYHKVIHQLTQGSNPAAIAGVNQVYSKLYLPDYTGAVSDTQLFNRTGGGGVSQLTGNNAQTDGWVWAGGLLIQWGRVTTAGTGSFPSGAASGTVTFKDRSPVSNIPFPNNCFVVIPVPFWTTASTEPDGSGSVNINSTTLSNLKFDWKFNSNSGKYRGFYWTAIGN